MRNDFNNNDDKGSSKRFYIALVAMAIASAVYAYYSRGGPSPM